MTDPELAPFRATAEDGTWTMYVVSLLLALAGPALFVLPNDDGYADSTNLIIKAVITVFCLVMAWALFEAARADTSGVMDWFVEHHGKVVWIAPTQHSMNGIVISTWYRMYCHDGQATEIIVMTGHVPAAEAVLRKYCPAALWGVNDNYLKAWTTDPTSLPGEFGA